MKLQSPPLFVNSGHLSEIRESTPLVPRHSKNIYMPCRLPDFLPDSLHLVSI